MTTNDAETTAAFTPSAPPAPELSSSERSALRAQAHGLSPVVLISESGLTPNLIIETDRALTAHGLIKVRVFGDDREARADIGRSLCETLGCAAVQSIGKLLVLWRPQPESSKPQAPVRRRKPAPTKRQAAEGKTVGTPRKSRKPPTESNEYSSARPSRGGSVVSRTGTSALRTGSGASRPGPGGSRSNTGGARSGAGTPGSSRSQAARPAVGRARQAPSRIAKGAVNPTARPKTRKAGSR